MIDPSQLETWFSFFTDEPVLRTMQGGGILIATLLIFFVLYATRDILLRTSSLLYQLVCILIVALIPVVGFFIYLLIRPARTIKEREMEALLRALAPQKPEQKEPIPAGFSSYEAKAKNKSPSPKKDAKEATGK